MDRVDASLVGADKAGIRSRAGKRFNRFEGGLLEPKWPIMGKAIRRDRLSPQRPIVRRSPV
jgi:hypothetical protein